MILKSLCRRRTHYRVQRIAIWGWSRVIREGRNSRIFGDALRRNRCINQAGLILR
jgi:hypothetical protein